LRILIAAQRPDMRSALGMYIQNKLDLDEVVEAADKQALLEQADNTQPDIILLDWDSYKLTLSEVLPTLHLQKPKPEVVLINSQPGPEQAAEYEGIDAYVQKGTPPKSLLLAIETVRLKQGDDNYA